MDRFQVNRYWFQVDLDELYRFQGALFLLDPPPNRRETQNTAKKRLKNPQILEIPLRIRSWTDSNCVITGSSVAVFVMRTHSIVTTSTVVVLAGV